MKPTTFIFALTALNSEKTIEDSLDNIYSALQVCGVVAQTDIFIVDDGSTDQTFNRAEALSKTSLKGLKKVTLLRNDKAKGMSWAFTTAAEMSDSQLLVPAIGSNNMPSESWIKIIKNARPNCLLLGYRENLWSHRPPLKALASRFLSRVLLPIWGFRYRELTGTVVAPRVDFLRFVPKDSGHGWGILLVAGCELLDRPFREIWITLNSQKKGGTAKVPNIKYAWQILKALIRARPNAKKATR